MFAVGAGGLILISVVMVGAVFVEAIRQHDWATTAFIAAIVTLASLAIVGVVLVYAAA